MTARIKSEEINKGAREFLKNLLEKKIVDALIVPLKLDTGRGAFPAFVTSMDYLEKAMPFVPLMPVNTAKQVSKITRMESSSKKIGVVMRPCEIRAYIELIKFNQIEPENLLIIGTDCYGVIDSLEYKNLVDSGENPDEIFLNNLKQGKEDYLRRACKTCTNPVPNKYADIVMGYFGTGMDGNILLISQTEKGEEILKALEYLEEEVQGRDDEVKKLVEKRGAYWEDVKKKTFEELNGIDNLLKFFDTCIDCHNCKDQCPICFCKECFWESPVFEFRPPNYFEWAEKKGAFRLPTDTLFFHLGRLSHMSHSCVGCGMCEDACPKGIELQRLFYGVGEKTAGVFDYHPGMDLEEEPPLTTFREDELQELG